MGNYKIISKILVTVFSLAVFSKGREMHVEFNFQQADSRYAGILIIIRLHSFGV
jgi:hypothetical protein